MGGGDAARAPFFIVYLKITYFPLTKLFSANYKTLNFGLRCQENAYLAPFSFLFFPAASVAFKELCWDATGYKYDLIYDWR